MDIPIQLRIQVMNSRIRDIQQQLFNEQMNYETAKFLNDTDGMTSSQTNVNKVLKVLKFNQEKLDALNAELKELSE